MKKLLIVFTCILAVFAVTNTTYAYTADDFVITVDTTRSGSPSNEFRLPTTGGSYDATVEWGDGSTTPLFGTPGLVSHTYATSGIKTIVITHNTPSGFPRIRFNGSDLPNTFIAVGDRLKLLTIEQWGTNQWTSMVHAFTNCTNLVINATDSPDLSNVTSLARMFSSNTSMNQDISNWDVSNVTSMEAMFGSASAFNQPLDAWDVSSVTNMASMFSGATAFNQPLDEWDVSSVTNMQTMFLAAQAFNQPVDSWDVSSVTNMAGMFYFASSFNQPLNSWDVSMAMVTQSMFQSAIAFNQPLDSWNVSNVATMTDMFSGASDFNQPLGSWQLSNGIAMNGMLNNSGITIKNYSDTLVGWSTLALVPTDVTLGSVPAEYCSTVQSARDILTNTPNNWVINDDGSTPCFALTYSAVTNATLIGDGSQNIIAGEDGTEVSVTPDEGYVFIKWSDESTANPRTDLDVAGDITVTAIIEAEPSGGSSGTRTGVRIQNQDNLTTTSTPSIGNTDSVVDSVRALIERMKGSDEELKNLPPEEKKKLLLLLQAVVVQLLALLASL